MPCASIHCSVVVKMSAWPAQTTGNHSANWSEYGRSPWASSMPTTDAFISELTCASNGFKPPQTRPRAASTNSLSAWSKQFAADVENVDRASTILLCEAHWAWMLAASGTANGAKANAQPQPVPMAGAQTICQIWSSLKAAKKENIFGANDDWISAEEMSSIPRLLQKPINMKAALSKGRNLKSSIPLLPRNVPNSYTHHRRVKYKSLYKMTMRFVR
mmetsp:Transcript_68897/g.211338  ORF Transcript_68897/g.211338 Transcript_68897/m.211338 type:complete len:217 (+) Transcript_68897:575-1225(+)